MERTNCISQGKRLQNAEFEPKYIVVYSSKEARVWLVFFRTSAKAGIWVYEISMAGLQNFAFVMMTWPEALIAPASEFP